MGWNPECERGIVSWGFHIGHALGYLDDATNRTFGRNKRFNLLQAWHPTRALVHILELCRHFLERRSRCAIGRLDQGQRQLLQPQVHDKFSGSRLF